MRKETYKIAQAFYRGVPAKAARTRTDGQTVWLHDNRIAWRTDHHEVCFTLAGWATVTTRERINGLLEVFGYPSWGISQRNYAQYLVYKAQIVAQLGDYEVFSLTCLDTFEKEYKLCA